MVNIWLNTTGEVVFRRAGPTRDSPSLVTRRWFLILQIGKISTRHLRGRPRLAEGNEAVGILAGFARLSELFGAPLNMGGAMATLGPHARLRASARIPAAMACNLK